MAEGLKQGDVIRMQHIATLVAPAAPSFPLEMGDAPSDESLTVMDLALESGLAVIITHDCDLDRPPEIEPYLHVASLRPLDGNESNEIGPNQRMSMRYCPFPDPTGDRDDLFIDMRLIATVERSALEDHRNQLFSCPLNEVERAELREWLGARFGRNWFEATIDKQLIRPTVGAIERLVKTTGNGPSQKVLKALRWIGIAYNEAKPMGSFLLMFDPIALKSAGGDESAVKGAEKELRRVIHAGIAAAGGSYRPLIRIQDPYDTSAADMLSHFEVWVDLPA